MEESRTGGEAGVEESRVEESRVEQSRVEGDSGGKQGWRRASLEEIPIGGKHGNKKRRKSRSKAESKKVMTIRRQNNWTRCGKLV